MERTTISPIPCRSNIAWYAQKYFNKLGRAVEVGVWEGEFAAHNLKSWQGEYHLVDTWGRREDDLLRGLNDKNIEDWDEVYKKMLHNTKGHNTIIHKGLSVEAAKKFDDGFFDWVYVDAGHDYQNAKADLEAWWDTLRVGGLLSGDDYGMSEGVVDTMNPQRWAKAYTGIAITYKWGVINALDEFCKLHKQHLHITYLNDGYHVPAWYIIKE